MLQLHSRKTFFSSTVSLGPFNPKSREDLVHLSVGAGRTGPSPRMDVDFPPSIVCVCVCVCVCRATVYIELC